MKSVLKGIGRRQSWLHEFKDGVFRCTGKPSRNVEPQGTASVSASPVGAGTQHSGGLKPNAPVTSTFDRKKYQREYMREYRAKRKAGL